MSPQLEKERQAQEEAEWRASEEYIQRLLAEDEQRLAEERRKQEESQQQDEQLARQISQELVSLSLSCSIQWTTNPHYKQNNNCSTKWILTDCRSLAVTVDQSVRSTVNW